jgi:hypothetical protein
MRKLFLLSLLLIAPRLHAQTCTAASTSSAAVQAALNSCGGTGTVIIPTGSSTWSSIVSITPTGPLTIQGTTTCTGGCAAGSSGTGLAFTDSTNITLNNSSGAFQITGCSAANLCTISNITFINGVAAAHGELQISGTHGQVSFRAHHLHFTDTLGTGGVLAFALNGYGLIDHMLCDVTSTTGQSTCLNMGGDFPTGGTLNWQDATVLGANQAIIVEDSVFNGPAACATVSNSCTEGVFDAYYGAKVVIRNSIINNWNPGGGHGSNTAYWRSMVTGEFYGLTISNCSSVGSGNGLMNSGGGVLLFHDNIVTGNCNSVALGYLRGSGANPSAAQWGIPGPGLNWSWTVAGGPGLAPLTLNAADFVASNAYAALAAVGPVTNNTGGYNYQLTNGPRTCGTYPGSWNQTFNATTTDSAGCIWHNVGGTTAAGAGGAGWLSTAPDTTCTSGGTCTYFADNANGTAPFRDMVGVGHNQVVMPNYAWNNSGAGLPSPVLSTSQTSLIVSGTNYFNTTAMPGYTPYTYPDPLQGSATSGSSLTGASSSGAKLQ